MDPFWVSQLAVPAESRVNNCNHGAGGNRLDEEPINGEDRGIDDRDTQRPILIMFRIMMMEESRGWGRSCVLG